MHHEIAFSAVDARSRAQRDAVSSRKSGDAADAWRKATLRAAGSGSWTSSRHLADGTASPSAALLATNRSRPSH